MELLYIALITGALFLFLKYKKMPPGILGEEHTEDAQKEPEQEKPIKTREYPYTKKMLLTKAEYVFYKVLKEVCDENELLICPKVRMEDFLEVTDKKNYMKYRGYIKSRHIDFMLCDANLRIIAGLELDDNSHKKANTQETDDFKNNVFKTVGIPLYRVKMSDGAYRYQLEWIITDLKQKE